MNLDKVKELLKKWNDSGYPSFVMEDKVTGLPSLTYTIFYINALIALGGLLGRFASVVKGVDADAAKELLIVSGSLYLGRALTKALTGNNAAPTTEPTQPTKEIDPNVK